MGVSERSGIEMKTREWAQETKLIWKSGNLAKSIDLSERSGIERNKRYRVKGAGAKCVWLNGGDWKERAWAKGPRVSARVDGHIPAGFLPSGIFAYKPFTHGIRKKNYAWVKFLLVYKCQIPTALYPLVLTVKSPNF